MTRSVRSQVPLAVRVMSQIRRLSATETGAPVLLSRGWVAAAWTIAALAFAGELARPANHDVAWFMYIARRMLQGDRLYVDLMEDNPPPIIWLNFPALFVARLLHMKALDVFRVAVAGAAVGSALVTGTVLARSRLGASVRPLAAALAALLFTIIPGTSFAQREHVAAIAVLPYLALSAAPPIEVPFRRGARIALGLLAGLGMTLKAPLFLLWGILTAMAVTRFVKRRVPVPAEHLAALGSGVVMGLAVWFFFPRYFPYAVVMAPHHYRFAFQPMPFVLFAHPLDVSLLLFTTIGLVLLWRTSSASTAVATFLVGGAASLVVVVLQHKGYDYHHIPGVTFAAMGLGLLVCIRPTKAENPAQLLARAALTLGFFGGLVFGTVRDLSAKVEYATNPVAGDKWLLRQLMMEQPGASVMVLSTRLPDAFPLVEDLGFRYVGGPPSQWQIPEYYGSPGEQPQPTTYHAPGAMPAFERLFYDRAVRDLTTLRPQLLLVEKPRAVRVRLNATNDFDFLAYLAQDSAAARALQHYRFVLSADRLLLYRLQ